MPPQTVQYYLPQIYLTGVKSINTKSAVPPNILLGKPLVFYIISMNKIVIPDIRESNLETIALAQANKHFHICEESFV